MNAVSTLTTYELYQAISQAKPPASFFKDTFFSKSKTFVTEEILVDYKKGKRVMAPFVSPRQGGITIHREGFETKKITTPRIAPQRALTIGDLSSRGFGESLHSLKTPAQRQMELESNDVKELDEMIAMREEWMAVQLLIEGKVDVSGRVSDSDERVVEQEVDYGFTNNIALSGTSAWNEEDADIYGDISNWRRKVIRSSGVAPDTLVLGEDAANAFLNNKKLMDKMNKLNYNIGAIEPKLIDDAITFIGRLPGLGIEVYSYDEWFIDDEGVEKPYIPEGVALLAKANSGTMAYGAISQMNDQQNIETFEGRIIPKKWADVENDVGMLRLSSRPLPIPDDVDSWVVAQVIEK